MKKSYIECLYEAERKNGLSTWQITDGMNMAGVLHVMQRAAYTFFFT